MKLELTRKPEDPDRCGYGWFSTDDNDPFNCACFNHDHHYEKKDCTLLEADNQFACEVMEVVDAEPNWWKRQQLFARAVLYIGIVRSLGWVFWIT